MIGIRFLLLTAAVPMLGAYVGAARPVRNLPRGARLVVYVAAGLLTIVAEMLLLTVIGLRWNLLWIALPPLVAFGVRRLAAALIYPAEGRRQVAALRRPFSRAALVVSTMAVLLFAAAVMSAEATSFDFLLFWGGKGQRFGLLRGIDWAFLADPDHKLMHPDYPPLVPLYYAWTMLGGTHVDWFGAIASAPLFLGLAVMAFFSFARYADVEAGDALGALFASMFALLLLINSSAGNAEPALLFFETLALAGVFCWRERPDEHALIVALALAGCVLTKVEGLVFAAGLLVALLMTGARIRMMGQVAIAPAAALASWIGLCARHGLLDAYRPGAGGFALSLVIPNLATLVREASFHLLYAPWVVVVVLILCGRWRAAVPAFMAAVVCVTFLLYAYSRGEGAEISWSATRVLMTPLLILFFGALASLRVTSGANRAAAP
jgi:hypothetical protein